MDNTFTMKADLDANEAKLTHIKGLLEDIEEISGRVFGKAGSRSHMDVINPETSIDKLADAGIGQYVNIELTDGRLARFDIANRGYDWVRLDSHDCLGKSPWNESGSNEGGIADSDLHEYLCELYSLIPDDIKAHIPLVKRYMNRSEDDYYETRIFVPDASELFGKDDDWYPDNYPQLHFYKDRRNRMKASEPGGTEMCYWWTASASSGGATGCVVVNASGLSSYSNASGANGVPVCFQYNL